MRYVLACVACLVWLSGCATPPPPPRLESPSPIMGAIAQDAWFALGTEPFWNVEVTPDRITFHDADGRRITVAHSGWQTTTNGRRAMAGHVTISTEAVPCNDGMSDRRYADTVTVVADGRTLAGCGGRVLPPTHLDGTSWRVITIDGAALPAGRGPAELRFSGNQISGSVGCNRLSGAFSSDGTRLTIGRIASTRMACEPALMTLETRLAALLGQSLAMRFDGRGRMTLTGNDDAQIVLERSI